MSLACLDCGKPYSDFPLDSTLPDSQWRMIHDSDNGVLCANCMVLRASKLNGVIAVRMTIEFADNVTTWPGTTLLPLPPSRIAEAAQKADLSLCIMIGVDKKGDFYFASSDGDVTMVLWQLERAKRELFKTGDEP